MAMTIAQGADAHAGAREVSMRITILYNNVSRTMGLTSGWGFSCLVEGLEKTILFDTGGDGDVLLANMARLGIDPKGVDVVFLSHIHGDHTGGLDAFLVQHSGVEVILPAGFPPAFLAAVSERGAAARMMTAGGRFMDRCYTTGPLQDGIVEQAMIVETKKGLVVITGCAHPGIARIAASAMRLTGRRIHLFLGGFHLLGKSPMETAAIISRLKSLGVAKVAPSHCTGEAAVATFRQAWGGDFIEGGLGSVIEVPLREGP
jgi:7,8-dihydropterin-6-yl-methyl-4-(beta-D-ribofuranosyl)aminobenzene 5'-phosphate synthase